MATAPDACSAAACEVVAGARESALRLQALLQAMGADPGRQNLAEQIVRCIDRALAAVRGAASIDDNKRRSACPPPGSKRRALRRGGETAGARVLSAATDDGFAWRKYGEKAISHRRYPRFYFRCTYRDDHGCGAKKQVQQTQERPPLFETTYFGTHTAACPGEQPPPLAAADRTDVVPFLVDLVRPGGSACSGHDEFPQAPSLPAPNVAAFSEEYWPVEDRLTRFVSADPSFPSPAAGMESSDDSLDELVSLLWS